MRSIIQKKYSVKIFFAFLLGVVALSSNPSSTFAEISQTNDWSEDVYGDKNKVICVTIPKAGTHLLIKCLTLLNIEGVTYNYNTEKKINNRKQSKYKELLPEDYADRTFARLSYRIKKNKHLRRSFLVHLPFTPKYKPFFDYYTTRNFLMIRDPRDQMISLASTGMKEPAKRDIYLHDILMDLIQGKEMHIPWSPRHGAFDMLWTLGTVKFYHAFLRWQEEPNFYVVRFENLVGPQGGGSSEAQIQEIRNIANHLGKSVTDEEINYVIENLFGETRTFKQGQIKAWQKYFSNDVKEAFKKMPGACQLLIDLGYEQDENW